MAWSACHTPRVISHDADKLLEAIGRFQEQATGRERQRLDMLAAAKAQAIANMGPVYDRIIAMIDAVHPTFPDGRPVPKPDVSSGIYAIDIADRSSGGYDTIRLWSRNGEIQCSRVTASSARAASVAVFGPTKPDDIMEWLVTALAPHVTAGAPAVQPSVHGEIGGR